MQNNKAINAYGLFSTIVVAVVGVGIFSYPRELAIFVGNDGWIIALLAGLLSYLLLYAVYKVSFVNNFRELPEILNNNFGKVLGRIIAIIFMLYSLIPICVGMRIFIEVVKMYLLDKTPTEFLIIITILTGTYLIRGGLNSLIRFNEISFWMMFIPLTVVFIFCLSEADFTNLLPILNHKPEDYIKALQTGIYSFAGYEIAYFLFPLMQDKKVIKASLKKSMIFITIFYVITIILCIAVFTKTGLQKILWPTITMIKSINIEGSFIERWEGVVMALWIIFYFTTFVNSYYFSNKILDSVLNIKDIKITTLFSAPVIYILTLYPQDISDVYNMLTGIIPYLFLINMIILPVVLLLISSTKKGVKNSHETQ